MPLKSSMPLSNFKSISHVQGTLVTVLCSIKVVFTLDRGDASTGIVTVWVLDYSEVSVLVVDSSLDFSTDFESVVSYWSSNEMLAEYYATPLVVYASDEI